MRPKLSRSGPRFGWDESAGAEGAGGRFDVTWRGGGDDRGREDGVFDGAGGGGAARAGAGVDRGREGGFAETWGEALPEWGIGEEELARFRERTELRVITPGGLAGEPLHLLSALERQRRNFPSLHPIFPSVDSAPTSRHAPIRSGHAPIGSRRAPGPSKASAPRSRDTPIRSSHAAPSSAHAPLQAHGARARRSNSVGRW